MLCFHSCSAWWHWQEGAGWLGRSPERPVAPNRPPPPLQAWADAFRSSPDLTGVVHAYEELKRKGMEFPMADLDALSPIHTPQRVSLGRVPKGLLQGQPLNYAASPASLGLQGVSC